MAQWADFPIDAELFTNADETILSKAAAAIENAYTNETKGQSRFPGRIPFAVLSGTRTYLTTFRNNLIAGTDEGKLFRIDKEGNVTDVTKTPVSGGMRMIFSETEDELLVAAGGPIIRLSKSLETEVLSEDAPQSTHVVYVDGFVLAIEPYSGRFFHSKSGQFRTWDPIDVFVANGKPDPLRAVIVTPFRELLLAGVQSVEQFERIQGDVPFARRWSAGEGLEAPYTFIATDDGVFGVNPLREFVRFNQQVTIPESNEIGFSLESIDNWDQAWCQRMHIKGQKFIILQAPFATNIYGTEGVTALFDYRARRWSNLYDWDEATGIPQRWLPWSYQALWGRHFVGVPGGVMELTPKRFKTYDVDGSQRVQRVLVRTGHVDKWGTSEIRRVRLRLRRGDTDSNADLNASVALRAIRDNKPPTKWKRKKLGRFGQRELVVEFGTFGYANTWQFEYSMTGNVPLELSSMKVEVEEVSW